MSDEEDQSLKDESVEEEPIQRARTRALRGKLAGQDIAGKITNILTAVQDEGMDLPLFLDMLFWGHPDCHAQAKFHYARTSLLVSEELPNILDHWHQPPCTQNKGHHPAGAHHILRNFAVRVTSSLIDNDMETIACHFYSKPADLTKKHLTTFDFHAFASLIKREVPLLWKIFERVVFSDAQGQRNIQKDLTMDGQVILCMISQGQYCQSH
ncbi:hypothetical protein PAXRUDRAFT_27220 [Paxillus rubicundulus Ve08.2h10]|uniref:Uncharacterized protein n=1 Tax=Paxillus rubicundulus Ve08.2h10 TaxID=930991 RepID=A0A0D0DIS4_9AGAM|nr:hypothetical protein PAXRUDRAFT_27220 [Paxillus rubicundulus Ve08.2h10]